MVLDICKIRFSIYQTSEISEILDDPFIRFNTITWLVFMFDITFWNICYVIAGRLTMKFRKYCEIYKYLDLEFMGIFMLTSKRLL